MNERFYENTGSPTDVLLMGTNGLHKRKYNGNLGSNELSQLLINFSNLYKGAMVAYKISEEDADNLYNEYFKHLEGKNADKYFQIFHEELDNSAIVMKENISEVINKRNDWENQSKSIITQEEYESRTLGFRKLGH